MYPAAMIAPNVMSDAESARRANAVEAAADENAACGWLDAPTAAYHTTSRLTNVRTPSPRWAATLGGLLMYLIVKAPTMIWATTSPAENHEARHAAGRWSRARHAAMNVATISNVRMGAPKRCVHS